MPSIEWLTNTWRIQHMTRVTKYYMTCVLLQYIHNEIWKPKTHIHHTLNSMRHGHVATSKDAHASYYDSSE